MCMFEPKQTDLDLAQLGPTLSIIKFLEFDLFLWFVVFIKFMDLSIVMLVCC
jgi:hypothetical protein